MKILILSWRDIKHPYGGGAELLSHEMAKRWVKLGHKVTHFSANFPDSKSNEIIDGVNYIRAGNWYNIHILAFFKILSRRLGQFDVVIDEVHGIPFFSYLYICQPIVCLACEVAKEVWDKMYLFPINIIGRIMEKAYLLIYRKTKFLTISNSTASDLIQNGIPQKNITVLPMGLSCTLPKNLPPKNKYPTIIFLGRLAKSKGIKDALEAFSLIHQKLENSKMLIVGKGTQDYELELKKYVRSLNFQKEIEFKGFVSEQNKFKLLAKSHLILVPSIREGWGLIVPEANLVGTPAIVYNVPGLRDVTKNNINGVVVPRNTPQSLAQAACQLLINPKKYQKLTQSAKEYARSMNWDDTAKTALKVIQSL